ncbi:MAG: hypothetical protein KJZ93_32140 [Caldilineaceae bacterium]|nr:hypothetical protein [Caldilineaceae bacterium]
MRIEHIRGQVRAGHYLYSQHADIERQADELTFAQIEEALLHYRLYPTSSQVC